MIYTAMKDAKDVERVVLLEAASAIAQLPMRRLTACDGSMSATSGFVLSNIAVCHYDELTELSHAHMNK